MEVTGLPWVIGCLLLLGVHTPPVTASPVISTTYCVSPTETGTVLQGLTCYPLSYYVEDVPRFFTSHTQFLFLPGNHTLETGDLVVVGNQSDIVFLGNGSFVHESRNELKWAESTSRITCGGNFSGFAFVNVTNLSIINLTFEFCGGMIPSNLADEVLFQQTSSLYKIGYGVKAAVFLANVSSLTVDGITVRDSVGYGVLGINVLGESLITQSVFVNNNFIAAKQNATLFDSQGGNFLLVFGDSIDCRGDDVQIQLTDSLFAFGVDKTGVIMQESLAHPDRYIDSGSGLGFMLAQTAYFLQIDIENIVCANNSAFEGANLRIDAFDVTAKFNVSIRNVTSYNGTGIDSRVIDHFRVYEYGNGVGFKYQYGFSKFVPHCTPDSPVVQTLSISNSTFRSNHGNKGVGMELHLWPRSQMAGDSKVHVFLTNCTFTENVGCGNGFGLCIAEVPRPNPVFNIVIQDMKISDNMLSWPLKKTPHSLLFGLYTAVTLASVTNITIRDSLFTNNRVSALYAFDSSLTLAGEVEFSGNTGIKGGAMILDGGSIFYLRNSTSVYFTNNSALESGGALYVYTHVDDPFMHTCFFQLAADDFLANVNRFDLNNHTQIRFKDNSAIVSGSDIYGGAIERCYLAPGPVFSEKSSLVFAELFHFDSPPTAVSSISSPPYFVCPCQDDIPDCNVSSTDYYNISGYPGGTFILPVAAVGQMKGVTEPAAVNLLFHPYSQATLGAHENPQDILSTCGNLTYTIFSTSHLEIVHFEVQGAVSFDTPRGINVNLQKCPLGFQLSKSPPYKCNCIPLLSKHKIQCNIIDKTIRRTSDIWIGNSSEGIVVGRLCPFDYCVPCDHKPYIHVDNLDEQCAYNRRGRLCGECSGSLSLVLGSSRCKSCRNIHLLLLIAFAGAGLALVFFLILFNLTVSVGTINGLILYANVLQVNNAVFFQDQESFFSVFISWLNLDLGIETCFYDGLSSYAKAWLQFVFPVYIWVIMGCIIFLCKYSVTVTRLCGSNAVPVLATLLLLSFTKIESIIITILQYEPLHFQDGTSTTVWMYNGNVKYFDPGHIPLFAVAVLFLTLSITYALLVMFSPWILTLSKPKWISKYWKPVFDAYQGPFKSKHRYWTGLVLLVRCVLCLTFAVTADILAVNLLVISISTLLLISWFWGVGGVYRRNWLNMLEFSFLLNLGIVTVATMYSELVDNQQKSGIINTSVGIAFATFVGILLYHIYEKLKKTVLRVCTAKFTGGLSNFHPTCTDHEDQDLLSERVPILRDEQRELSSSTVDRPGTW